MSRNLVRSLAAVLTIAAASLPALAADLGRPAYKAAPAAAAYNWSGFYAGIVGGYGWLDHEGTLEIDGGFVGGTLGANWQAPGSPLVFGVEADMSWADIGGSATETFAGVTTSLTSKADWYGTARLRGGVAFDSVLIYATGGIAWAHNDIAISATSGGVTATASSDKTHVGWTVGGGAEIALGSNWTAKAEYLFIRLDEETYFANLVPGGVKFDGDFHAVRAGLNYRFGTY